MKSVLERFHISIKTLSDTLYVGDIILFHTSDFIGYEVLSITGQYIKYKEVGGYTIWTDEVVIFKESTAFRKLA